MMGSIEIAERDIQRESGEFYVIQSRGAVCNKPSDVERKGEFAARKDRK